MTFLTNWVFWVIVITIIILMAIIGYLAEGTELGPKSKRKPKEEQKESNNVEEISVTEEANEPSAWTGEITKDERHEQVHDVPSLDDWTNMPTETPAVLESKQVEEAEETELFNEISPDSTTPNVESINPQVLENLDSPLEETTVEEPNTEEVPDSILQEFTSESEEENNKEQMAEVLSEENNNSQEQLIDPAPIFDTPTPETVEPMQEQLETLEIPEEENKQETNTEDIWK